MCKKVAPTLYSDYYFLPHTSTKNEIEFVLKYKHKLKLFGLIYSHTLHTTIAI